jgi:Protein of unknown function (DUF4058)
MPVHDWRKVEAGTFHAFHNAWNTHLMGRLNSGILPEGYYALAEQHVRGRVPDVLTFQLPERSSSVSPVPAAGNRGIALADSPPQVRRKLIADASSAYRARQRTLTIRRTSGHHIVALLEIVSPGNKDRALSVEDFVLKIDTVLSRGIHVVVVDLFPPGKFDPRGIHGEIWSSYASQEYDPPAEQPLTLSSYLADHEVAAYVNHLNFDDPLPEMPLFLDEETYIYVPLETTYKTAFQDMPEFWRGVLEGKQSQI